MTPNKQKNLFKPSLPIQRYSFVCKFIEKLVDDGIQVKSIADLGSSNCRLLSYVKEYEFLRLIQCIDLDKHFYKSEFGQPKFWKRSQPLKVEFYVGDVLKKDPRVKNVDLVTCIELIQTFSLKSLDAFAENVFGFMRPQFIVVTTPNFEYNDLIYGHSEIDYKFFKFREFEHQFEFTQQEFQAWCMEVIDKYKEYSFEITGVGRLENDIQFKNGFCTQIAIFTRMANFKKQSTTTNQQIKDNLNSFLDENNNESHNYKLVKTFQLEGTEIHALSL